MCQGYRPVSNQEGDWGIGSHSSLPWFALTNEVPRGHGFKDAQNGA